MEQRWTPQYITPDQSPPHGVWQEVNPHSLKCRFIRGHVCSHFSLQPLDPFPFKGLSFVDVGCGGGLLSESLARLGASVIGIDAAESNIKIAAIHSQKDPDICNTLTYQHKTAEALCAESPEGFDVVCALEIIEHVGDVPQFLESLSGLVKPGGAVFMSTMNKTLKAYLHTILMAEHVLGWVPVGTHDWNQYIPPKELKDMLQKYGVQTVDTRGFGWQPLNLDGKKWGFSSDESVNYLLYGTKNRNNKDSE